MEKPNLIQVLNAADLESDLLHFRPNARAFISQVHPIFHINRIEDYIRLVDFPRKGDLLPRKMTVYSIFFLTKGKSIRRTGLNTFTFTESTFFFTPAYEITSHEYISPEAEGFYLHFNLDLLTSEYRLKDLLREFSFLNYNTFPIISIDDATKNATLNIMHRLENEYKKGDKCRQDILRIYLIALFTELNQSKSASSKNATTPATLLTEQYKNALSKHIYQKQKVSEYADLLNVTPNHLNKCIQQTLNQSALDLIHEMPPARSKSATKTNQFKHCRNRTRCR